MTDIAIQVESLSKRYSLGQVGTGTLAHDLNRWWSRLRGKEDPFRRVDTTNTNTSPNSRLDSDHIWALRDISFEVRRGEVLGIIGGNGAGKSTLLKILSRITAPTAGRARMRGRVGSLLDVGTGFHPELTGRDNIYLCGAILGMARAEVAGKFEEIVAFSGCERYIDTPVKRYSPGMVVRLCFAVAAHLEPEILLVDEVLAVGDAEFRKKCLGKMQNVAGQGRTILFVSHNMSAIRSLCTRCMALADGMIERAGEVSSVVDEYLAATQPQRGTTAAERTGTAEGRG